MQPTDQTSMEVVYSTMESMSSGARYQRVATYCVMKFFCVSKLWSIPLAIPEVIKTLTLNSQRHRQYPSNYIVSMVTVKLTGSTRLEIHSTFQYYQQHWYNVTSLRDTATICVNKPLIRALMERCYFFVTRGLLPVQTIFFYIRVSCSLDFMARVCSHITEQSHTHTYQSRLF